MSKHFAIGVVMAALCLALVGCGSDGPNLRPELNELTEQLGDLKTDLETEREEAAAREKKIRDDAAAEKKKQQEEIDKAKQEAEAEKKKREAQQKAAEDAERARQEAERKVQEAQQREAQTRREAQQQIEDAQRQADVGVRVGELITELTGIVATDVGAGMGVNHAPGESRTFTRPSDLPSKGSAPSVPGSWSSASYSGPRGNVGTDTVYLYTNIQAPSSKVFWKVHGESVTVNAGALPTEPKATVSGFGTSGQDRQLHEANKATLSRSGTYDGYSGTFKCTSANDASPECNISANTSDVFTFVGSWTFTTSLTAKRNSRLYEQDTEFLYFGIWAYEPTSASADPDFKWAAGGDATDITNFGDLTGTAGFTGGAVGKYALAKVEGRAARAARIGTFTATATFTANFDTNKISGRITNFKEGGSDLGADWNVFLGSSASAAADLAATGATGTLQAHGAIDGDTATGAWAATLHGSDNGIPGTSSVLSNTDKYPRSQYPVADVAGVAGWFSAAAGTSAAIAGAFGAACTTGSMCAK